MYMEGVQVCQRKNGKLLTASTAALPGALLSTVRENAIKTQHD